MVLLWLQAKLFFISKIFTLTVTEKKGLLCKLGCEMSINTLQLSVDQIPSSAQFSKHNELWNRTPLLTGLIVEIFAMREGKRVMTYNLSGFLTFSPYHLNRKCWYLKFWDHSYTVWYIERWTVNQCFFFTSQH